jgi:hypothetical protein
MRCKRDTKYESASLSIGVPFVSKGTEITENACGELHRRTILPGCLPAFLPSCLALLPYCPPALLPYLVALLQKLDAATTAKVRDFTP